MKPFGPVHKYVSRPGPTTTFTVKSIAPAEAPQLVLVVAKARTGSLVLIIVEDKLVVQPSASVTTTV